MNSRLARHATLALIRQEMDTHPVDKEEHWNRAATAAPAPANSGPAPAATSPYARVARSLSGRGAGCLTRPDSE